VPILVNIGVGGDLTIVEVAKAVHTVLGYQGNIVFDTAKPDGISRRLLNVLRTQSLEWRSKIESPAAFSNAYADLLAWQGNEPPSAAFAGDRKLTDSYSQMLVRS